ncbi:MAG: transaldolase [candidate division WOR-3 bacterium]|nr:MAG: transaldolase [candidate division WOR-3 bacterium]
MAQSKMQELADFGQSIWLDYISRSLIETGRLKKMIAQGLRGMTSNPTIFDNAVSASADYDKQIAALKMLNKSTFEIYDELTVKDIQAAADLFRPVYEKTNNIDGHISLEVNPKLAYNIKETIEEAKRLYTKVNRPNVMFKVPSTDEGFAAIEELLAEGININITLIFSVQQYTNTAEAYIKGIERLLQKGGDVSTVCSVSSVFVSRIDTLTDKLIDEKSTRESSIEVRTKLEALKGTAAVANSAMIYKKYQDIFSSNRFKPLQEKGANVQRLLWGSTSTKNPAYSDIKYVTELIGKHTINTIPEHTLDAFLDHGVVKETLTGDTTEAQKIIDDLRRIGIDIDDVCKKLLKDGVVAFEKSFDSLLNAIEQKSKRL